MPYQRPTLRRAAPRLLDNVRQQPYRSATNLRKTASACSPKAHGPECARVAGTQQADLRPAHIQFRVRLADEAANVVVVEGEAAETHTEHRAQATLQPSPRALAVATPVDRVALRACRAAAGPDRRGRLWVSLRGPDSHRDGRVIDEAVQVLELAASNGLVVRVGRDTVSTVLMALAPWRTSDAILSAYQARVARLEKSMTASSRRQPDEFGG